MSIQFNSMAIVVAAVCTALNVGGSSAKATAFHSGLTNNLTSGSIILAQFDEMSDADSSGDEGDWTSSGDEGEDSVATTVEDTDTQEPNQSRAQATKDDPWAAVGDGATMQEALGGGNPADIEARKQAAEQAVQAYQLAEYWATKEAQEKEALDAGK